MDASELNTAIQVLQERVQSTQQAHVECKVLNRDEHKLITDRFESLKDKIDDIIKVNEKMVSQTSKQSQMLTEIKNKLDTLETNQLIEIVDVDGVHQKFTFNNFAQYMVNKTNITKQAGKFASGLKIWSYIILVIITIISLIINWDLINKLHLVAPQ